MGGLSIALPPLICKQVCAGKKKNLMYEQCRDSEGKIVSMRRVGECSGGDSPTKDPQDPDVKVVEVDDN